MNTVALQVSGKHFLKKALPSFLHSPPTPLADLKALVLFSSIILIRKHIFPVP